MAIPIENGKNLGPRTGPDLREAGVDSLETLREIGWEEALTRVCQLFPDRIHTMMAWALMGAEYDLAIEELRQEQKDRARRVVQQLRNQGEGY